MKLHGDKLAEAFAPAPEEQKEEEDHTHSDVRLLSRHPAARTGHVVRR